MNIVSSEKRNLKLVTLKLSTARITGLSKEVRFSVPTLHKYACNANNLIATPQFQAKDLKL